MQKIIMSAVIFLVLVSLEKTFAFSMPAPPIDIDMSNATFEKIDATKFRIRHALAPGYPGTYWGELSWNRDQLLFLPMTVGRETVGSTGRTGVAIVGKGGAVDYTEPIAAMNDIATWCGTPSETNPCLLRILPGIYDIGTNSFYMRPYVDVEGSGENVTKIRGTGPSGVIMGDVEDWHNPELRLITIEHGGGTDLSVAIVGGPSLMLTDVTAISTAGSNRNYGIYHVLFLFDVPSSPPLKMKNVTVVTGGGTESIGVRNDFHGGSITIEQSSITGTTNSVYGGSIFVAGTRLNGPVGGLGATCAGVYGENYVFHANTCP